jgi:hypothetical protein
LATECYEKCIKYYLNNLSDCNRQAEIIERQSIPTKSSLAVKVIHTKIDDKLDDYARYSHSLKTNQLGENHQQSLTHQFNFLSINLDNTQTNNCVRQSNSSNCSSYKAMSCNDTNNNCTDSTNQLKDPPRIVLSDFSANNLQPTQQSDSEKKCFSDKNSGADKNCLAVPISRYSSEARPP